MRVCGAHRALGGDGVIDRADKGLHWIPLGWGIRSSHRWEITGLHFSLFPSLSPLPTFTHEKYNLSSLRFHQYLQVITTGLR